MRPEKRKVFCTPRQASPAIGEWELEDTYRAAPPCGQILATQLERNWINHAEVTFCDSKRNDVEKHRQQEKQICTPPHTPWKRFRRRRFRRRHLGASLRFDACTYGLGNRLRQETEDERPHSTAPAGQRLPPARRGGGERRRGSFYAMETERR